MDNRRDNKTAILLSPHSARDMCVCVCGGAGGGDQLWLYFALLAVNTPAGGSKLDFPENICLFVWFFWFL